MPDQTSIRDVVLFQKSRVGNFDGTIWDTVQPDAGASFEVWPVLTGEGLHPCNTGYNQISAGFQTWLASIGF